MKNKMLNLLAISMIALDSGGLKANVKCTVADNKLKTISVVNKAQEDVHLQIADSSASMETIYTVIVPANKTKQIQYCKNDSAIGSIVFIFDPQVTQLGGAKFGFADLFDQLKKKDSGSITITVGPSTAGLVATAQIK